MTEKRKSPALRFRGYTDDWEQRKLIDEVASIDTGKSNFTPQESGQYEILGSTSVIGYDDTYDYEGDFLLTARVGANAGELYRYSGKVKISDNTVFIKGEQLDFVYYALLHFDIKRLSFGTGQPLVKASELKVQEIMMPVEDTERTVIGEYFANLDNLITLHQRKLEKLKLVKKSMLEKMFPKNGSSVPEIRFKGFTDDWEQRKFNDIATRESAVRKSSPDCPSIEYEDVVAEAGILNKDIRLKDSEKNGIIFDGSQVLYGKLRPYLHNWHNPDFEGVAVGDWWVLKPIHVDKSFLYRLIQTQKFDDIANQSSGSKMPRADWNLVSNSEFSIPPLIDEQVRIGTYFNDLDNLITLHQRKVEKLKILKKSMLEKMFV